MQRVVWDSNIDNIEGESSCMPTGIKADCEDGVYVTGFMGSNKGLGYCASDNITRYIANVSRFCPQV